MISARVVAIDGPAGAGKSTVARELAERIGWRYVDTGAMYRAVGVLAFERGIATEDDAALARLVANLGFEFSEDGQRLRVDGREVSTLIRRGDAGELASRVSTRPVVRERLVALQRGFADAHGVVMEGRDIGTVVFPEAVVKIFLTADPVERARRRAADLRARGEEIDEAALAEDLRRRDERDANRPVAPLRPAADAVRVDTTGLGFDAVVARLTEIVRSRLTL